MILRKICTVMEMLMADRLNLTRTIYINFRCLPFKQAIRFPIYIYGKPRFDRLCGKFVFDCEIKRGLVKINMKKIMAPCLQTIPTQLVIGGTVIVSGEVFIGTGNKILVADGATLRLGKCTEITDCCNVVCYNDISIGDCSYITHRCQVYDTNNHFVVNLSTNIARRYTSHVHIGSHCWICNECTLSPGTAIPDHIIVASKSMVNKDMSQTPQYSLLAGIPAKAIANGLSHVFNQEIEAGILQYFANHNEDEYHLDDSIEHEQLSHLTRL